jgi:hypothetical protein
MVVLGRFKGVLDLILAIASVAYGLRRLSRFWTGAAIRVMRTSDNSELDIGFIGEDLDVVTLLAFVGSGSGFVTTWYDQSGNGRNATQTTAGSQPQIVVNGVVQTQNEKPAIRLQTSQLDITGITSFTSGYVGAIASVAAADDNAPVVLYSSGAFLGFGSGGSQVRFRNRNPDPAFTTPPSPYAVSNPINTNTLMSYTTDGVANINNYLNGALVWQDTSAASFNPVIGIGGNHFVQTITNGKVQEVVIFNTTFSTTDRQTLERNQGSYYNITVA